MDIHKTRTDDDALQFEVTIPAAELEERIVARLTDIGKKASLSGFRPGRAPLASLRERYGEQVYREVVEEVVATTNRRILEDEENLVAATGPEVVYRSLGMGQDLGWSLVVVPLPDVEIAELEKLSIEMPALVPSEAEIERLLEALARRNRSSDSIVDQRSTAQSGDLAILDYTIAIADEARPPVTNVPCEIGAHVLPPAIEDKLPGMTVGTPETFPVSFPDDFADPDLAGKETRITVTVTDLRTFHYQPVDDSLAQKLGLENMDRLRENMLEALTAEFASHVDGIIKRRVLDALDAAHDFPCPQRMVDAELRQLMQTWQDARRDNRLESSEAEKSADETRDELTGLARRRVKLALILTCFSRQQQIGIDDNEFSAGLDEIARGYTNPQEFLDTCRKSPALANQYRAMMMENKLIGEVRRRMDKRVVSIGYDDMEAYIRANNEDEPSGHEHAGDGDRT